MSSTIFPWCTEYKVDDLPDIAGIRAHLKFAGDLARACAALLAALSSSRCCVVVL
jgi:hypothetical protein